MTDKRKKRIRDLASRNGINRRAAATLLDACRARARSAKAQSESNSELLTLGQVAAAVHDLFAEIRDGATFTTQVNSLRRPEPYVPYGPVPEVPLVSLSFERTDAGWIWAGTLAFVDGEVYDGLDKLDAGWTETEDGRDRVRSTLRREIERTYRPLGSVLTDLRVEGGRSRNTNILVDVRLTLAHPLYALLRRLRAPSTFGISTGCRSHRDAPFRGIFPVARGFRAA